MNNQMELEEGAYQAGHRKIAGVDEAGRGPLAGPVVAAACILPRYLTIKGIDDSKKLAPKRREDIYYQLCEHPDVIIGVGIVESLDIDKMNILKASLYAMTLAIKNLSIQPDYILIDGNQLPPTHIASKAVIKGDSRSLSIGAASIIAKYHRDRLMVAYHEQFPQYGFDQHKGYGTQQHLEALKIYGPCILHRLSFEPVRALTYELQSTIHYSQTNQDSINGA